VLLVKGQIAQLNLPRNQILSDSFREAGPSRGKHRRREFLRSGSLRRSSSKKLKMQLTLLTAGICSVPGTFSTAKRLPSGCKSKLGLPSPRSVNWPGDQS
jgi:hypothetical protein